MTTLAFRTGDAPPSRTPGRRKFGLDAPLPADRRIIERAILRHLATCHAAVVPFCLQRPDAAPASSAVEAGVPDLMLLAPGGRIAFVRIKTQAEALTRADRAFADLCRACAIPCLVVRSLPEARRAFDALAL